MVVLVVRVLPNTAAASAGIRRGDVILDVDGTPVSFLRRSAKPRGK